jgi:hypothetical protein
MTSQVILVMLPNFDLAAPSQETDSHGAQEVVSCVGMVVYAAVEDGSNIFADTRANQGLASRVVFDKIRHVMNNAGDDY